MDLSTASPDRICEEYRGFVHWVVKEYFPSYCNDEEFFQEGWIGLWEAAKKYDETRGVKFTSFAFVFVRRRCFDELKLRRRHASHAAYSLDETHPDSGLSRLENTAQPGDETAVAIGEITANQLLEEINASGLTKTQLNIMSCRIEGQTLKEISKNVGICTSRVHDGLKVVRQAVKTLAEKY